MEAFELDVLLASLKLNETDNGLLTFAFESVFSEVNCSIGMEIWARILLGATPPFLLAMKPVAPESFAQESDLMLARFQRMLVGVQRGDPLVA